MLQVYDTWISCYFFSLVIICIDIRQDCICYFCLLFAWYHPLIFYICCHKCVDTNTWCKMLIIMKDKYLWMEGQDMIYCQVIAGKQNDLHRNKHSEPTHLVPLCTVWIKNSLFSNSDHNIWIIICKSCDYCHYSDAFLVDS